MYEFLMEWFFIFLLKRRNRRSLTRLFWKADWHAWSRASDACRYEWTQEQQLEICPRVIAQGVNDNS